MSEPKHFLNKKFAITFVILLLLGTGAYAGIQYWQNQQVAQEVAPTFTPRPSATVDPTADWKTYTNTQYGFEVKYPSTYQATYEVMGDRLTISDGKLSVFTIIPGNIGRESEFDKNSGATIKPITLAGKSALEYKCPEDNACPSQFTYYTSIRIINPPSSWNSANEIHYDGNNYSNYKSVADQILSTFKFTDSADTSTWKTYTNTQYGFEFKYPDNWEILYNSPADSKDIDINLRDKTSTGQEWPGLRVSSFDLSQDYSKAKFSNSFNLSDLYQDQIAIKVNYQRGMLYAICQIDNSGKTLTICNQILSTFKFTQ